MSENVIIFGVMAPLTEPVGDYKTKTWSELSDLFDTYGLYLNYEGTLIYTVEHEDAHGGIYFSKREFKDNFIKLVKDYEISVILEQIQFYTTLWYNGADSYMSEITIKEFEETLG